MSGSKASKQLAEVYMYGVLWATASRAQRRRARCIVGGIRIQLLHRV
jgi:hypothetical protein